MEYLLFLRSIELYGFKSFADRTRLEFAPGTSSLLGPNGCGKSNIVDAIKWVLGEQSTKSLRAGKMEDVIFNGTEKRPALNVCEVSLVINNELQLLPSESSEVEIRRRLYRSGESEFFINRQPVRLKDIRELFFDTGVGKSAYSILEQGKIDQILSTRPEDRRYIFEEAAGITRFRKRSEEAARKLARTQENIEQVETLLKEIKRQYDSRKVQADRALSYKEMSDELFSIDVSFNLSSIRSFLMLKESKEQDLEHALEEYEDLKESIEENTELLDEMKEQLRELNSRRVSLNTQVHQNEEKKKGTYDRLELLTQRYHDFHSHQQEAAGRLVLIQEKIEQEQEALEDYLDRKESLEEYIDSLEEHLETIHDAAVRTRDLSSSLDDDIREAEQQLHQGVEEQGSLLEQLREISEQIVRELEEKLASHSYSKASRELTIASITKDFGRARGKLASLSTLFQVSMDDSEAMERVKGEIETLLRGLEDQVHGFLSSYGEILDTLVSPQGAVSKKHDLDTALSVVRDRQEYLRSRIAALRQDRSDASGRLETLRTEETEERLKIKEAEGRLENAVQLIESLQSQKDEREFSLDDARHDAEHAGERMDETMQRIEEVKEEQSCIDETVEQLKDELAGVDEQIERQTEKLNEFQSSQSEQYERVHELRSSQEKYRVQIESINEQIAQVYHLFFDTYGRSLREFEENTTHEDVDETALRERQKELKRALEKMGYINHMAAQEFEEVKERYDFLHEQMRDLLNARENLNRVIQEITTKSEQLFTATYHQIRAAFHDMFHRMFAGGRAELKLIDPEHPLSSGIEILAQPPGKKLDRLAPLSGGEKSLTAVALLFATYSVKPSPFCILDEIDAALDDRNIGFFLDVLKDFSEKSQFIIITHNKHTVLGSQTLLGVTMQEKGISKAVAYRMGFTESDDVIFDDTEDVDNALPNEV